MSTPSTPPISMKDVATELGVTEDEVLEAMDVSRAYRGETIDRSSEEGSFGDADGRLGVADPGFDLAQLFVEFGPLKDASGVLPIDGADLRIAG